MAEAYGKLPTKVAEVYPAEFTRMERFRLNRDVFYATTQHKNEQADYDKPTSGVGTEGERKELIDNQENRATVEHGSVAAQRQSLN